MPPAGTAPPRRPRTHGMHPDGPALLTPPAVFRPQAANKAKFERSDNVGFIFPTPGATGTKKDYTGVMADVLAAADPTLTNINPVRSKTTGMLTGNFSFFLSSRAGA